ncbi:MAG: hypothetical protein Q8N26_06810 [Myxococcales bacterium]|nr:hypothetical protein [Myxococcales bacterium]
MKPIISECGNGQGWLPKYRTLATWTPTSSCTSRTSVSSSDSPTSENPARVLKKATGNRPEFASSASSPRRTRVMMAGVMRG